MTATDKAKFEELDREVEDFKKTMTED